MPSLVGCTVATVTLFLSLHFHFCLLQLSQVLSRVFRFRRAGDDKGDGDFSASSADREVPVEAPSLVYALHNIYLFFSVSFFSFTCFRSFQYSSSGLYGVGGQSVLISIALAAAALAPDNDRWTKYLARCSYARRTVVTTA